VCADCGVVESVQAVQRKGEGSGVGAVAGGVIGGALGHQVGDGQGRTAMTVLGAIGGGFAGNEVEKRARATTVYRVRVRTDNGTLRTLDQASAPAVGQRVRIEGHKLQLLSANKATG
jgi:outer membrane lipoprotein SlyB